MIQIVKQKEKYTKAEVMIEGGAFTKIGTTAENLKYAVEGETFEYSTLYPEFAKIAKQEGYPDIAARILSIAVAETHHAERYKKLLKEVKAKTVYKKKVAVEWMCTKYGYVHKGKSALEKCPSCGHDKTYAVVKSEKYGVLSIEAGEGRSFSIKNEKLYKIAKQKDVFLSVVFLLMQRDHMIANIQDFPIVPNICNQDLRELITLTGVSVAHVIMQPNAVSLLHSHRKMREIYYILSGEGIFYQDNNRFQVAKGSPVVLPPKSTHKLQNTGTGTLEHLVFAVPPFDPKDVRELHEDPTLRSSIVPLEQKELPSVIARDGGIVRGLLTPRESKQTNISLAEGYLPASKEANIHHHNTGEEIYYVISGQGMIQIDRTITSIGKDDIIKIPKKSAHGLSNYSSENIEIICLCTPPYQDSDFKHSNAFKSSRHLH